MGWGSVRCGCDFPSLTLPGVVHGVCLVITHLERNCYTAPEVLLWSSAPAPVLSLSSAPPSDGMILHLSVTRTSHGQVYPQDSWSWCWLGSRCPVVPGCPRLRASASSEDWALLAAACHPPPGSPDFEEVWWDWWVFLGQGGWLGLAGGSWHPQGPRVQWVSHDSPGVTQQQLPEPGRALSPWGRWVPMLAPILKGLGYAKGIFKEAR